MLASGCAAQGIAVTVLGPSAAGRAIRFASVPGVSFCPVEFGDRPRAATSAPSLRLRRH